MDAASSSAHLFGLLRSLNLPAGDYAVFGSGPLLVRAIIERAGDLDVLCRGAAWEQAQRLGPTQEQHGVPVVSLFDGAVTLGVRWAVGDLDADDLINTAEEIDGLPFVRLEHVAAYKRLAGRPKDREHLRRLDEWRRHR
ncbi:MAG: hypothetical protein JW785_00820 [Acidimicrobiia bacterium]|nr:hypothetical protein [Acidimicrobiia bacterium]